MQAFANMEVSLWWILYNKLSPFFLQKLFFVNLLAVVFEGSSVEKQIQSGGWGIHTTFKCQLVLSEWATPARVSAALGLVMFLRDLCKTIKDKAE